jgi:hypothetical protein
MRAKEFIVEADIPANPNKLPKDHTSSLKGALSMPDISINKSNGNPYAAYRFGIAMAGSPDYDTEAAGAFAGDPLLTTYTDHDYNIIQSAAKMVGAGKIKHITNNRSEEHEDTNKISPVANWLGKEKNND